MYTDVLDAAAELEETSRAQEIERVQREAAAQSPFQPESDTGEYFCYQCYDEVQPVTVGNTTGYPRWCCSECRDLYQKAQGLRARMGGVVVYNGQ